MHPPNASVGERIRTYRMARGFSQAFLAGLVGVTGATLSRWETGHIQLRVPNLEVLARALGVTPEDLVPAPGTGDAATVSSRREAREIEVAVASGASDAAGVARARAEDTRAMDAALPNTVPTDLMAQADVARVLRISRQAVNSAVQGLRLKGYPNPKYPHRGPLVSLAEVRMVLRRSTDKPAAAAEGQNRVDPLKQARANDDATGEEMLLPSDATPPGDGDGEDILDPPWLTDSYVLETARKSSAAFTGKSFDEIGATERRIVLEALLGAMRKTWREKSPEERAERVADWRRRHP